MGITANNIPVINKGIGRRCEIKYNYYKLLNIVEKDKLLKRLGSFVLIN